MYFNGKPSKAMNLSSFEKSLGFAFERWCLKNEYVLSRYLGIHRENYRVGSYFSRKAELIKSGFQIDLMYIIDKRKIIFCEMKYYKGSIPKKVFYELENKIDLYFDCNPTLKRENLTIEKVLITTGDVNEKDKYSSFFDEIIVLDNLFDPYYYRGSVAQ